MRSRPSSGRRRAATPPEFLIDRSLSQVSLPAALREVGLIVQTLTDVYGQQAAQETDDATWLTLAGERGWVVLCKDDHIRRRPAELQALTEGNVRLFCLTNAQLTFADQAEWFLANRHRIIQASRKPGPYVYGSTWIGSPSCGPSDRWCKAAMRAHAGSKGNPLYRGGCSGPLCASGHRRTRQTSEPGLYARAKSSPCTRHANAAGA